MILDGHRAFALVLSLWAAAAPAQAQYTRTGLLRWGFDDITANSGAGRVRTSQWAQDYRLGSDGPLFNPMFGAMHNDVGYSEGASISQTANTGIPRQQMMEFTTQADLFRPWVRHLVRFSPNYSRTYTHRSGDIFGHAYANTTAVESWGFSTGLTLPRLPSLGYSRQINELRSPSDINPIFQKSTTENRSAGYVMGHVVAKANQDISTVDDLISSRRRDLDLRRASLEGNYYETKHLPLQSFYFRSDFGESLVNGTKSNEQNSTNFNLATRKFKTGRWESYLRGGSNASRDFMRDINNLSENTGFDSKRFIRSGNIGNSLSATHSPTSASESAADSLNLNRYFWRDLLSTSLGCSGGWSRSPFLVARSDAVNGRLNLYPAMPWNYFTEASTSGSEAIRGSGGGRTNHLSLGANGRSNTMTMMARLDQTQSRNYAAGTMSLSDQLNVEASGRPSPKLFTTAGYGLGITRSVGTSGSVSHNLRGSVDYYPVEGLTLTASAVYTVNAYTTSLAAVYSLGKTTFKMSYDYQEISTLTSFSHLSISLSRML